MWHKCLKQATRWVRTIVPAVCVLLVVAALPLGVLALRRGMADAWLALVVAILLVVCSVVLLCRRRQLTDWLGRLLVRCARKSGKRIATEAVATSVAQSQEWLAQGGEVVSEVATKTRSVVREAAEDVGDGLERGLSRLGHLQVDRSRRDGVTVAHGVWTAQASSCAACGRLQRQGARFCDGCGEALPQVCPSCGADQCAAAAFCYQCGASLSLGETG